MIEREPYDSSDERQVKKRKTKVEVEAERDANDMRTLLDLPQGRRVLMWIVDRSGLNATTYKEGSFDITAYNEGARALGLMLQRRMKEAHRERYYQAEREAETKEEETNE